MEIPFTAQQFFNVFKTYNEQVYPMQYFLNALALIVIYYVVKQVPKSGRVVSGLLTLLWLWMGCVYHLKYCTTINKAAVIFGLAFILQGILFLIIGVFKKQLSFKFRTDIYGLTGLSLLLYALLIYPLYGYSRGHVYPLAPTFGLPCPTTVFTFGILLLADKKIPLYLLIIPLIWSVIGFSAAFNFGMVEDTGLIIAGVMATSLILIRNNKDKPGKELLRHSSVAIVVALIIGACYLIYRNIPNDIPKYNEKMNDFVYNESKALEFYRLSDKMPKERLLSSVKDKGLYYWNENIRIVREADQLILPKLFHERNKKMIQYCELRIKSYNLIYKSIEENTAAYTDSIEIYKVQITELMKAIKEN